MSAPQYDTKKHPNAGQPWGPLEDQKVIELYHQGYLSLNGIARYHGRTPADIRYRLAMLLYVPSWDLKFPAPKATRTVEDTWTSLHCYGSGEKIRGDRATGTIVDDLVADTTPVPHPNLVERVKSLEEAICPRVAARLTAIEKLLGIK